MSSVLRRDLEEVVVSQIIIQVLQLWREEEGGINLFWNVHIK